MKPFGNSLLTAVAASALCATLLAACGGSSDRQEADSDPVAEAEVHTENDPSHPEHGGEPLATGAPVFASLYPDATLDQPVIVADGSDGPGGMAEFTTAATPDDVISHYRRLASEAGLKPVMAMNQGNARAFAALGANGAEVQVVASHDENEATSVQLTWKDGR